VHYNVNVSVKTNCQMLSRTDVSLAHDGRLGGSRWYGWWWGDCSICQGSHWEGTPSELCPASFDGSGSSSGWAKLAYIQVGQSKHDKVREVQPTSMVESLMHDSSNFEGDMVLDRQPV